ncbi:hypothetical protein F5884DRAFT_783980, partial [Xylogone sp. PMI_703]
MRSAQEGSSFVQCIIECYCYAENWGKVKLGEWICFFFSVSGAPVVWFAVGFPCLRYVWLFLFRLLLISYIYRVKLYFYM